MLGGIDIGTTGCKITVYTNEGEYCYRAYHDYPASRTTGEHEVEAADIWNAIRHIIADAAKRYPDIDAIGITSFGESFVMLDEDDKVLCPVMLYTDPRGTQECAELTERLGRETIERIVGTEPHSMYSLPKIMWMKKHRPGEFARTRRILLMQDYIVYMLTGHAVIDYSLAARSMAFDISEYTWSDTILEAAGIDRGLFSEPVLSGTAAGTIKPELARELGLTADTMVVPAAHDQVSAAVGAGVFETDSAVDGAGTVECITPVFSGIPDSHAMAEGKYAVIPFALPGKYVTYAFTYTGGALISWFISQMAKAELALAKKQGRSVYEVLEQGMKDEPTGILVLPHFAGAGTPYMDVGAKGAVLGLTVEHTTSDLYRAMMEGVVYEMRLNLEYLARAGICPKRLRASGGGASSGVWMQMKADILNLPVTSLGSAEAGAAAGAMMAGVAAGVFESLDEAAEKMITEKETYDPRPEAHRAYEPHYERYKKLYEAVRPLVS
ncbi:MAG: FGGY-family carbohydrate kinase [Lachnospiraceae bacterium]|nr:FGGY-family carbohydrate kinase [Lachnospiraceae bacterium]